MKLYEGTCNEDYETASVISREALHLLLICCLPPSLPPSLPPFCLFPRHFLPLSQSTSAFVPPPGSTLVIPQSCSFCSPSLSPPASSVCFSVCFIISIFFSLLHHCPPAKTTKINFLPWRPVDCRGSSFFLLSKSQSRRNIVPAADYQDGCERDWLRASASH